MTQDASELDYQARDFKNWLRHRLLQAKRDEIDALGKKLEADKTIPRRASRSMYLQHLKYKGFTVGEITVFAQAWKEMYLEAEAEEE